MFLRRVCVAKRRSSSILISNSNNVVAKQAVAICGSIKEGSDEWKQPCIYMTDTLMLGPVPASTFLKAVKNRKHEIKCLAVKVFRSINL